MHSSVEWPLGTILMPSCCPGVCGGVVDMGVLLFCFGEWAWSLELEGTAQHGWHLDSESHCRGMDEGLP